MSSLNIGLVGYCPPTKFDEDEAKRLIEEALDRIVKDHPGVQEYTLVSGLTDVGVLAIGYRAAKERGWMTVGIACSEAYKHDWFDEIDEHMIVKGSWGVETETFLSECDVLLRIGGGKQSRDEAKLFASRGGIVYAHELAAIE